MYSQPLVLIPYPDKTTIDSTYRNSSTCYPSASIAADGEHPCMVKNSCCVTDVVFLLLTLNLLVKGVKHI